VFDVSPCELARRTLEIVVLDYDRYSHDECVGQVHCPLDQLAALPPGECVALWKGITAYEKQSEVGLLLGCIALQRLWRRRRRGFNA